MPSRVSVEHPSGGHTPLVQRSSPLVVPTQSRLVVSSGLTDPGPVGTHSDDGPMSRSHPLTRNPRSHVSSFLGGRGHGPVTPPGPVRGRKGGGEVSSLDFVESPSGFFRTGG